MVVAAVKRYRNNENLSPKRGENALDKNYRCHDRDTSGLDASYGSSQWTEGIQSLEQVHGMKL